MGPSETEQQAEEEREESSQIEVYESRVEEAIAAVTDSEEEGT